MTRADWLPWGALALTVLIWSSYLVTTRAAMTATLSATDIGLLRSLPAALCLLPWTLRRGLLPGRVRGMDAAILSGFGGIFFVLLLSSGLRFAPVADSGVFAPSMLPVFVALLSLLVLRTRPSGGQLLGLALILAGALAVGGLEALMRGDDAWRGHVLFLGASLSWAIYTIRFRTAEISPFDGTLAMVTWAAIVFTGMVAVFGTGLWDLPPRFLAVQLVQGFASGLIANLTFMYAIKRLGHTIPAASAALVPVLAALGGLVFLGEPISALKWAGIVIVASGVILASGVLTRPNHGKAG